MKKIFFSTLVLSSVLMFAQIDLSSTRYGLTGGTTYSRITNAHNPSGARYSGYGGVMAMIPVDNNDQFYIQPQVEYYGAGESGKDKNAKGASGYDAVYANNYISVPIYFKGYFSENESEFFAMAGPRFNFLINQKVEGEPTSRPYYKVEQSSLPQYAGVNGKASSFNYAVALGAGFSYKRQLEVTVRYDLGLGNVYKNLMNEPGTDPNIAKKKTEQVVSLGLSYIFE